jgi:hypothetical protein
MMAPSEQKGLGHVYMPARLVALDEGQDIVLDRHMVIVGRHPQCDARLESLRISRRHCCMTEVAGEVEIRDLGSTNGIRINGHRVDKGTLKPGDEVSIAHIRYRVESDALQQATLAEPSRENGTSARLGSNAPARHVAEPAVPPPHSAAEPLRNNALEAAVRGILPADMAQRCKIQVIVQVPQPDLQVSPDSNACPLDSSP